jgi:putative intracellular protease/amidase
MQQQAVHLAVYDALADWEYGYAVAGVNDPQFQREPGRYRVVTVAETGDPVTTAGGVRIVPELTLDQLSPQGSAMLVMPGAHSWHTSGNTAMATAARRFLDAGVPVAAICGGTFGLANAGVLDDYDHTSSALEYLKMAEGYHGEARYRDEPAVTDRGLITAGPAHALDFARAIFAQLELYAPETLEAWYGYYRTGDAGYYYRLMEPAVVS